MLNKKDIDEKKFESSFRGYSKEEVDDFLDEVSASVGEMTAAFVTLEKKYESLRQNTPSLRKISPPAAAKRARCRQQRLFR